MRKRTFLRETALLQQISQLLGAIDFVLLAQLPPISRDLHDHCGVVLLEEDDDAAAGRELAAAVVGYNEDLVQTHNRHALRPSPAPQPIQVPTVVGEEERVVVMQAVSECVAGEEGVGVGEEDEGGPRGPGVGVRPSVEECVAVVEGGEFGQLRPAQRSHATNCYIS